MAVVNSDGSLYFVRGDDIVIPLEFYADDGLTPIDLTGCTIKSEIRTRPNGFVSLTFAVEYTDRVNGKVKLYALHDATALIRSTEAVWDVQICWAGGLIDTIIGPSTVSITKDVTLGACT